ncbi:MAG: hypothetical protein ACR2KT_02765 [Methylocella sp.]|nr:MAG: hypothetical protein DLM68_15065 [Hyphomicrobiales bacterium]
MATVWAFREGVFGNNPGTGWSHTIKFGENSEGTPKMTGMRDAGTNDLIDKLEDAKLRSKVERLAIIAHGLPGGVYMSGQNRRQAIPQHFRDLAPYIVNKGMLTFESCNAGKGPQGTLYLMEISRQLPNRVIPNRVIVGYSIWGFFEEFKNDPGNVQESKNQSRPTPGTPRMTAWGDYAKWAHNGQIVRLPMDEQKDARNRRCANPNCIGHASERDRCPYRSWGKDPTLLSYDP